MCIDPHQTGFVGKGSDHLQLIKFWLSRAPGKRFCSVFDSVLLHPARSVCVSERFLHRHYCGDSGWQSSARRDRHAVGAEQADRGSYNLCIGRWCSLASSGLCVIILHHFQFVSGRTLLPTHLSDWPQASCSYFNWLIN